MPFVAVYSYFLAGKLYYYEVSLNEVRMVQFRKNSLNWNFKVTPGICSNQPLKSSVNPAHVITYELTEEHH